MQYFGFGFIIIWVRALIGWVLNLNHLFTAATSGGTLANLGAIVILQIFGVLVAPVGAVLGWIQAFTG